MLSGKGSYLGTEVGGKWYRRYMAEGFFARGSGRWELTRDAFTFRRRLLVTSLAIPFAAIRGVRTGTWHAGKWVIRPVAVKIDWTLDGLELSSGFVFSRTREGTFQMAAHLEALAGRA